MPKRKAAWFTVSYLMLWVTCWAFDKVKMTEWYSLPVVITISLSISIPFIIAIETKKIILCQTIKN